MFYRLFLTLLIALTIVGAVFADDYSRTQIPLPPPSTVDGTADRYAVTQTAYPPYNPPQTDEIVGDTVMVGRSWCDIQHNATCGRQIQVDSLGYIHITWMNGLNNGASLRHIYYNLVDPNFTPMFIGGIQVDQSQRAGYTTLELHPDGRAMPCFHMITPASENAHSAFAFDYFPRTGAFGTDYLPWVYQGTQDLEVIWPKISRDINNRYHIVSTENPSSGVAGDPQRQYYCGAAFNPATFQITFDPAQQMISWTEIIGADVASSPVSERTAIGWLSLSATQPETTQYDNDLILCISEDGVNWNWSDTINVTNWIPPDYSLLPDTAAANQDTLRCYDDMSLVFDYNDVLHVFFTTRGYWAIEGTLAWGNGFIWHWDEVNQVFSMVATGWYDNGFYDPGAWNVYAQRPSGSVDPESGDIYCMYQRYLHPVPPTPAFPYLHADTTDFSAAGYPNGEIWVTKSVDGGLSWAEGTDITNTHSPDATAGSCLSELTPSMAPQIYDDNLNIFYILDADAGAVVQSEGVWTLNFVVCHQVPVSLIPATPVLGVYPMHCDSTGMPGWTPPPPLEVELVLTPHNPPIVIPPGGGNFIFDLEVDNLSSSAAIVDIWTDITLPSGVNYPIITRSNLTLAAGQVIFRPDLTQFVPGTAIGGQYYYNAYVRDHNTWELLAEDTFPFTKEAADGSSNHNSGWALLGWDESSTFDPTPLTFTLKPASPNPFNASTTINFELPSAAEIELAVYDIQGRLVQSLVTGHSSLGKHSVIWDASAQASGVYFIRLMVDSGQSSVRKVVLMK